MPMDGGYAARTESSGSRLRKEWCAIREQEQPVSYTWDFVREADTFPELSLPTDETETGDILVALSIIGGAGATKQHTCTSDQSPTSEGWIVADTFGFGGSVDFGTLDDTDPDPLRVLGSDDVSWVDAELDVDLEYTATYDLEGSYCTSLPDDDDGDRLPNDYETGRVGSDPSECDTDEDTYWDAIEVASGSSPTDPAETPDTLPGGIAPASVVGRGDAGVTCGRNKFGWVSPTLQNLGGAKGKRGCIFLLSNATANGIVDLALSPDKDNITQVLSEFVSAHLLEIHGEETVDWMQEWADDATVWATKAGVKRAMFRAFNLTRLNAAFTVGRLAGLAGVTYGALWKLNQIRNNDACIQVRVGANSTGGTKLSWSLVYSAENLTSAGLKDDLHEAGVWKKKVIRFAPDRAVRRSTNLSCRAGKVRAFGDSAAEVFKAPTSFIF